MQTVFYIRMLTVLIASIFRWRRSVNIIMLHLKMETIKTYCTPLSIKGHFTKNKAQK